MVAAFSSLIFTVRALFMKTQYLILKRALAPALYPPPEFSVLCVRQFSQQILLPSIKWTTLGVYNPKVYKKQRSFPSPPCIPIAVSKLLGKEYYILCFIINNKSVQICSFTMEI